MTIERSIKNCSSCLKNYTEDFFIRGDICCSCIHKEKLRKIKDVKICKICKMKILSRRFRYCSQSCANKGNMEHKHNWWIYHLKTAKIDWKTL